MLFVVDPVNVIDILAFINTANCCPGDGSVNVMDRFATPPFICPKPQMTLFVMSFKKMSPTAAPTRTDTSTRIVSTVPDAGIVISPVAESYIDV